MKGSRVSQNLCGIILAQVLKLLVFQIKKMPGRYVDYCKCTCKRLNADCGCDFKSQSYISAICIEHIMFVSSIFNHKIMKTVFDFIWKELFIYF